MGMPGAGWGIFCQRVSSARLEGKGSLMPPSCSNPGPTGGPGQRILFPGAERETRQPVFCSTANSYKGRSNETLRGARVRTGGRADRLAGIDKVGK